MGLKFKTDFHSKTSVYRHELGRGFNAHPRQFQHLSIFIHLAIVAYVYLHSLYNQ